MAAYDVILTCNYSPWSRYSGGGQKSTHMIAAAHARAGLRVCVVYSKGLFERVRLPADLPYDVRWAVFIGIRPGISSPLRFLNGLSFLSVVRRLADARTALHANGEEGSLLARVTPRRAFVYSHRYPGFEPWVHRLRWNRAATWLTVLLREPRFVAMAMALRGADAVACTSRDSATLLHTCFQTPASKTHVIPNGLDPAFLAAPLSDERTRGVLYFGRMTRAKGVDVLLRAYAALPGPLRAEHPLTLIGEGPFLSELRGLADGLGVASAVDWVGWRDAAGLAGAVAAHRVTALPSREESFGNTMLETLAAGGTLVTTSAGSIPEVVADHAVLVPPDDVAALRAALEAALRSPADAAQARARREYARAGFSWDKTAERYRELYRR